jgi:hypothetical protein
MVWWVSAALALAQAALVYAAPMQDIFGTRALDATAWGHIALFGVGTFVVVEVEKGWRRWRDRAGGF